MKEKEYDFGGWATKFNIKCADGKTIRSSAFDECDGMVVPLLWNHDHNSPLNVLGHALLKKKDEGMYAYCKLNNTTQGKNAREIVNNRDISALSIFANNLTQNGGDVLHGKIREVSMVLAGANPGAYIDTAFAHGVESEDEAVIFNEDESIDYFMHSENSEEGETEDMRDEDMIEYNEDYVDDDSEETEDEDVEYNEDYDESEDTEYDRSDDLTIGDVIDTMDENQLEVLDAILDAVSEEDEMKHNIFENEEDVIQHDAFTVEDQRTIISDMKRYGSLKESFLAHSEEMGINDVLMHDDASAGITRSLQIGDTGAQNYFVTEPSFLFPEAKSLNNPPAWIRRKTDWVSTVMSGTKHTPFSRLKSVFADITMDEARAKGFTKGNRKTEEVFTLLKRITTPTTVYKKQKMDRDDVIDITDFDVIAWIRGEMRMMLEEELARAILVGDGRLGSSNDKINESNIRPIWTDDDLFTIKALVTFTASATDDDKAKALIKAAVKSRKNYRGSGNPVLFTTEDNLTNMLLLEDAMGYRIYKSEAELAAAMRVSRIITVQILENLTRTDSSSNTRTLEGLILNLSDYTVGADKGGAVSMFDDFDIDVNQQKYLIETRCSGALTVPYSAIALESTVSGS